MINRFNLPDGLSLRLAQSSDNAFLESLYHSTRDDLRLIDAEDDFIEDLITKQHNIQTQGNATHYPNAYHFVVEKLGDRIGRVIVDFGHNEIKILGIAFITVARGKGYGSGVLQGLQQAAAKTGAPLVLEAMHNHPKVKLLYTKLGFVVEQTNAIADRMVWYPSADNLR